MSNWTRHVKACQKLRKKERSKQQTLAFFLSLESATSQSGNFSDWSPESTFPSAFTEVGRQFSHNRSS